MKKILGISAFYHDSAACIVVDGDIIAAAQEERFTREKHTAAFPTNAIKFCLEYSGYTIDELDAIVFYDKPWLKFERLLETYYAFAPQGLRSFIKAMPIWAKEKLYLKKTIKDGLKEVESYSKKNLKLLFSEHHLSHAASAFYPSPYEEAAILTIDGVGEWCTASISLGQKNKITTLKEMHFPHSVGLLYSAFTYFLGFRVNSGEYKLMGLAPYGNPSSEQMHRYKKIIYAELIDVKKDGSLWMNQDHFDYAVGTRMVKDKRWAQFFGFPRRAPESKIEQHHCDLALAIQQVTEDIVIKMAREAKRLTGARHLCMAGGVALNCVANGKLLKEKIFDDVWIQPAAGDAGGALGAALAIHHQYFAEQRSSTDGKDRMSGALLGPYYSDKEVEQMCRRKKVRYNRYEDFEELCNFVASQLAQSKVVGWFQGRAEFGPRALGNRSILADPRALNMQKKLNLKVKFREEFRPFAPAVLHQEVSNYFDLIRSSPYMLLVSTIKKELRLFQDNSVQDSPIFDRLTKPRSLVNAITHVDFSARIQTVSASSNPKFNTLLSSFKLTTGCPMLVNTSFNRQGEPIVNTPEDAYNCFVRTGLDFLVINNYLCSK